MYPESERGFQIGDRVVVRDTLLTSNLHIKVGDRGVVLDLPNHNFVGVKFDRNIEGHDLNGNCESGYGYYVFNDSIALEENEMDIDDVEDIDMLF